MACGVEQKCSERYTALLRVYAIAFAAVVIGFAAAAVFWLGVIALILPAVISALMLWAVITLPEMYAARTTYIRHRDWFLLRKGLLWHRSILVPRRQIQYVSLRRNPLERLFGLTTLVFMTAGGRVYLHGVEHDEAERLRRLLERS